MKALRGQKAPKIYIVKLGKQCLYCSRDPKMLVMPELWVICQRELHAQGNQPERVRYVTSSKAVGAESSKPFEIKAPDTRH